MKSPSNTVWVLRCRRAIAIAIAGGEGAEPGAMCELIVESTARLGSKRLHRRRYHLVVAAMRRFSGGPGAAGRGWDYGRAGKPRDDGLEVHGAGCDRDGVPRRVRRRS